MNDRDEPYAHGTSALIAELEREVAGLRIAVQARDEFIATAAHELRNPMTPMLMAVQSMRSFAERHPELPKPISAGLARLDRVVEQYIRRADTLLDIARLASDTFQPEICELDMAHIVREGVEDVAPLAERSGSSIEVIAPEAAPGYGDELALQQIVENLLSNAVKYGGGNPISVHLAQVGGAVQLDICDQGIGITDADQARIFAPFERAVARRQQAGFGLGLWVVGRLVTAMQGTIQVASEPGRGSTFSVRLPLLRDVQAP